ncbi:hypothetical protein [Vibrio sp. H11]|nr:hypothetical protein [Vibrio sp. H11]
MELADMNPQPATASQAPAQIQAALSCWCQGSERRDKNGCSA